MLNRRDHVSSGWETRLEQFERAFPGEGEHQMKVLSEDPARQIAWTYDGKLALVSFPATSGVSAAK